MHSKRNLFNREREKETFESGEKIYRKIVHSDTDPGEIRSSGLLWTNRIQNMLYIHGYTCICQPTGVRRLYTNVTRSVQNVYELYFFFQDQYNF